MSKFKVGDIVVPNGVMKQNYCRALGFIKKIEVTQVYGSHEDFLGKLLEGKAVSKEYYTSTIYKGEVGRFRTKSFKLSNLSPSYEIF